MTTAREAAAERQRKAAVKAVGVAALADLLDGPATPPETATEPHSAADATPAAGPSPALAERLARDDATRREADARAAESDRREAVADALTHALLDAMHG